MRQGCFREFAFEKAPTEAAFVDPAEVANQERVSCRRSRPKSR
jgi:hypothetical protein